MYRVPRRTIAKRDYSLGAVCRASARAKSWRDENERAGAGAVRMARDAATRMCAVPSRPNRRPPTRPRWERTRAIRRGSSDESFDAPSSVAKRADEINAERRSNVSRRVQLHARENAYPLLVLVRPRSKMLQIFGNVNVDGKQVQPGLRMRDCPGVVSIVSNNLESCIARNLKFFNCELATAQLHKSKTIV